MPRGLALFLVLWFTDQLTLTRLAISQGILGLCLLVLARARAEGSLGHAIALQRPKAAHLRSSVTYALGIGGSVVQNDSDKVVMNASNHKDDSGLYAMAYRVVAIGLLPLSSLLSASHLSFLRVDDETDQLKKSLRLAAFSAGYAVVMMIGLYFGAAVLQDILPDRFAGIASILRWLAPVVFLRGVGSFPMNGLLGLGRNSLRTVLLLANATLALSLYLALIPSHSCAAQSPPRSSASRRFFSLAGSP